MTLVEMLVVLAIVGIAAGAIVLSLGGRDTVAARTEANRLADRLRLAADEAMIEGRPLTLELDPGGYAFQASAGRLDDWGDRHDLPSGVRLSAEAGRMLIDPDGAAPPAVLGIRDRRQAFRIVFDGLNAEVRAIPTGAAA